MANTHGAVLEQCPTAGQARVTERAGARVERRCRLCAGTAGGETVDAGGDIGRVHRTCFIEWDRQQETLEVAACVGFSLGDPGEYWAELEMEDAPLTRAA
jgi:hypothetical protein